MPDAGDTARTRVSLWLLAAIFAVAGVLHIVAPNSYTRIVPRWLPAPRVLVYVSGAFELLGGMGLLVRPVRRVAAWGLITLLVAVFPANVQMLQSAQATGASGWAQLLLWLRLPVQPLLMWWVYRSAIA